MANSYTQIYVHIIFSTHKREKILLKSFRSELFKYIAGIVNNKFGKALAVNGYLDHVHILTSMKSNICIADLVRDVKHSSTNFINEEKFIRGIFGWQKGYAAYSYSKSQIDEVINYIMRQEEHHQVKTFEEEYKGFLDKFGVEYDMKYVFDR